MYKFYIETVVEYGLECYLVSLNFKGKLIANSRHMSKEYAVTWAHAQTIKHQLKG